MSKFKNIFRIETARHQDWNYSSPWWYYLTINTKDHVKCFGTVINEIMELNEMGKIADQYWNETPFHFQKIELDYYIIMPNHIHGILIMNKTVETRHASSLQHKNITLSNVVGSFKSAVTKHVRELGYKDFAWQPRFYDRIIRNEKELYNIRKYIKQNPLKWEIEKDNPENIYGF